MEDLWKEEEGWGDLDSRTRIKVITIKMTSNGGSSLWQASICASDETK